MHTAADVEKHVASWPGCVVKQCNGMTQPLVIHCDQHGLFGLAQAHRAFKSAGCPECLKNIPGKRGFKLDTPSFIVRAKAVFGGFYSYSKVVYESESKQVIIGCPVHGEFIQKASTHLGGAGCLQCSWDAKRQESQWVDEFKRLFGNQYQVIASKYTNCKQSIELVCRDHGRFERTREVLLRGMGCPDCYYGETSFLYLMRLSASIWKVGVTNNLYQRRLEIRKVFPEAQIIYCWSGKRQAVLDVESATKAKNQMICNTEVSTSFAGWTECFSQEPDMCAAEVLLHANQLIQRQLPDKFAGGSCVFVLYDPRTNKPFFVGSSSCKPTRTYLMMPHRGARKQAILRDIRTAGLQVVVDIKAEGLSEIEAKHLRNELIMQYRRDGTALVNGRPRQPKLPKPKAKRRVSEASRAKMCLNARGQKLPPAALENSNKHWRGRHHTPEQNQKNAEGVRQYWVKKRRS